MIALHWQSIGFYEEYIFFIEPKFQELVGSFMDRSYMHFDNTEENKLIYTDLHQEYVNSV
jgi:ADP-ribosylation factor 2-binding protein